MSGMHPFFSPDVISGGLAPAHAPLSGGRKDTAP